MDSDDHIPPQINGDNVMRLELDMGIDFKNYERIEKVWGEEIVLTRSKYYTCKLLIVSEGFTSSYHKHLIKNETFICVKGHGVIQVDGSDIAVVPGEQIHVMVGTWHSFRSNHGMILMEVSTFDDATDNLRHTQSGRI